MRQISLTIYWTAMAVTGCVPLATHVTGGFLATAGTACCVVFAAHTSGRKFSKEDE